MSRKNAKNKKEEYLFIHKSMIEAMSKDIDGYKLLNSKFYDKTTSIKFSIYGKPLKIIYKPEIYNKNTDYKNINRSYYKSNNKKNYTEELYDTYIDHLAGNAYASAELGLDPINKR